MSELRRALESLLDAGHSRSAGDAWLQAFQRDEGSWSTCITICLATLSSPPSPPSSPLDDVERLFAAQTLASQGRKRRTNLSPDEWQHLIVLIGMYSHHHSTIPATADAVQDKVLTQLCLALAALAIRFLGVDWVSSISSVLVAFSQQGRAGAVAALDFLLAVAEEAQNPALSINPAMKDQCLAQLRSQAPGMLVALLSQYISQFSSSSFDPPPSITCITVLKVTQAWVTLDALSWHHLSSTCLWGFITHSLHSPHPSWRSLALDIVCNVADLYANERSLVVDTLGHLAALLQYKHSVTDITFVSSLATICTAFLPWLLNPASLHHSTSIPHVTMLWAYLHALVADTCDDVAVQVFSFWAAVGAAFSDSVNECVLSAITHCLHSLVSRTTFPGDAEWGGWTVSESEAWRDHRDEVRSAIRALCQHQTVLRRFDTFIASEITSITLTGEEWRRAETAIHALSAIAKALSCLSDPPSGAIDALYTNLLVFPRHPAMLLSILNSLSHHGIAVWPSVATLGSRSRAEQCAIDVATVAFHSLSFPEDDPQQRLPMRNANDHIGAYVLCRLVSVCHGGHTAQSLPVTTLSQSSTFLPTLLDMRRMALEREFVHHHRGDRLLRAAILSTALAPHPLDETMDSAYLHHVTPVLLSALSPLLSLPSADAILHLASFLDVLWVSGVSLTPPEVSVFPTIVAVFTAAGARLSSLITQCHATGDAPLWSCLCTFFCSVVHAIQAAPTSVNVSVCGDVMRDWTRVAISLASNTHTLQVIDAVAKAHVLFQQYVDPSSIFLGMGMGDSVDVVVALSTDARVYLFGAWASLVQHGWRHDECCATAIRAALFILSRSSDAVTCKACLRFFINVIAPLRRLYSLPWIPHFVAILQHVMIATNSTLPSSLLDDSVVLFRAMMETDITGDYSEMTHWLTLSLSSSAVPRLSLGQKAKDVFVATVVRLAKDRNWGSVKQEYKRLCGGKKKTNNLHVPM